MLAAGAASDDESAETRRVERNMERDRGEGSGGDRTIDSDSLRGLERGNSKDILSSPERRRVRDEGRKHVPTMRSTLAHAIRIDDALDAEMLVSLMEPFPQSHGGAGHPNELVACAGEGAPGFTLVETHGTVVTVGNFLWRPEGMDEPTANRTLRHLAASFVQRVLFKLHSYEPLAAPSFTLRIELPSDTVVQLTVTASLARYVRSARAAPATLGMPRVRKPSRSTGGSGTQVPMTPPPIPPEFRSIGSEEHLFGQNGEADEALSPAAQAPAAPPKDESAAMATRPPRKVRRRRTRRTGGASSSRSGPAGPRGRGGATGKRVVVVRKKRVSSTTRSGTLSTSRGPTPPPLPSPSPIPHAMLPDLKMALEGEAVPLKKLSTAAVMKQTAAKAFPSTLQFVPQSARAVGAFNQVPMTTLSYLPGYATVEHIGLLSNHFVREAHSSDERGASVFLHGVFLEVHACARASAAALGGGAITNLRVQMIDLAAQGSQAYTLISVTGDIVTVTPLGSAAQLTT